VSEQTDFLLTALQGFRSAQATIREQRTSRLAMREMTTSPHIGVRIHAAQMTTRLRGNDIFAEPLQRPLQGPGEDVVWTA
jgi:hypothetical protein